MYGVGVVTTFTPPAGMLEQVDLASGSGKVKLSADVADQVLGLPGATGVRTATPGTAGPWIAQVLALRPAPEPIPPTAPSAPRSPTAAGSAGAVTLTWVAPASNGGAAITGYNLYRSTSPGDPKSLLVGLGITTSYVDRAVSNGTTYFYEITAVNSVGEGPASAEVTATPSATATVPSAPRSLTATPGKPRGVALSWQAPTSDGGASITGYRIYRGTSSGTESILVQVGNVTTYKDTTATTGATYFYFVVALNSAGQSPHSNEASAVAR